MKTRISRIIFVFALLLTACGRDKTPAYESLIDLEGGKTFAVPTGTAADRFALSRFPDANIVYYNSVLDCVMAVKNGQADASVYDKPVLKNIAAKNPGLRVLEELLAPDNYGFAVQSDNHELKNTIDELLSRIKSDGTYQEMLDRWLPVQGEPGPMPDIPNQGTGGILRFGTAAVTEPMSYYTADQQITGFDIEFALRIAAMLNKKLEVTDMEFGAMLPSLISGKVDMIGAGLSITEERAKSVLFSEGYYEGGIVAIVAGGEAAAEAAHSSGIRSLEDIADKKLGVLMGSIYDAYAQKQYPKASIYTFNSVTDLLTSLTAGKIDAIFTDQPSIREIFANTPGLAVLEEFLFYIDIGAGFSKQDVALRIQFNEFLQMIRDNGIYAEIEERWMRSEDAIMPSITPVNKNGVLRVGVVSDIGLPNTARSGDHLIGFDIEIAARFAAHLGKELVFTDLPFASLLPSLVSGRIDMIAACMTITEERQKQIDFSDPYINSGASVIIRDVEQNTGIVADKSHQQDGVSAAVREPFFKKVSNSFYSNIIHEKRYLLILRGLYVTILITVLAAIFGTLLGGGFCLMRMSQNPAANRIARWLISLIRGTPVLVFLMITYYIIFASVNINPVIVAVIAFGINFAAYVSEMFRTAIESIDRGQQEAGIASGFTRIQTFIHIIAPQALHRVLPVYKGEFISLLKMTSIVGYIAVQDLTKASDIIRSRTFDAFFPLIMAAVIYIALAWLLTLVLDRLQINADPIKRRIKLMKEARR